MIPLDRVRELLSLAPGPHGGTLMDTSMVHDLARDVLSLADALATAERERDEARRDATAARSALDGLRSAVREYRDAVDHACVARGSEDAGLDVAFAVAEREDDAARAIDALLSAAPAPTTVPAPVVRAYLAAVEAARVEADPPRRAPDGSVVVDVALRAARTALDAALAAATTTPKESP